MFYLLSLLTGILECGWIAFGAVRAFPLWQILCFPSAYNMGNLFPKPFSLGKPALYAMGLMSLLTSIATGFTSGNTEFIFTCISLFLLSAVIQSVRSGMKSDGNRLLKRIFRIGGFLIAPLSAVIPSSILIFVSVISIISLKNYNGKLKVSHMQSQNGFSAVMIFHQLHYFFYAHTTLAIVSMYINNSIINSLYASALFCGTWITYMSVEPIVSKITNKFIKVFFAGHIGISILLLTMSFLTGKTAFLILWIITGFGGGAVYTISAVAKYSGGYEKTSMTIAENIGHVCGLAVAVVSAYLFDSFSLRIVLLLGATSAFLAVLSMCKIIRKENCYENI